MGKCLNKHMCENINTYLFNLKKQLNQPIAKVMLKYSMNTN